DFVRATLVPTISVLRTIHSKLKLIPMPQDTKSITFKCLAGCRLIVWTIESSWQSDLIDFVEMSRQKECSTQWTDSIGKLLILSQATQQERHLISDRKMLRRVTCTVATVGDKVHCWLDGLSKRVPRLLPFT